MVQEIRWTLGWTSKRCPYTWKLVAPVTTGMFQCPCLPFAEKGKKHSKINLRKIKRDKGLTKWTDVSKVVQLAVCNNTSINAAWWLFLIAILCVLWISQLTQALPTVIHFRINSLSPSCQKHYQNPHLPFLPLLVTTASVSLSTVDTMYNNCL